MSTAATTTTPAANGATASTSLNNTLRLVSFLKKNPIIRLNTENFKISVCEAFLVNIDYFRENHN